MWLLLSSSESGHSTIKWETARKAALARDEERCRRCLRSATDVHHRKPKGIGGTSDEERAFGLANLVSLCRECHNRVHANPEESYREGWLVHSWQDPGDIPVPDGSKYDF